MNRSNEFDLPVRRLGQPLADGGIDADQEDASKASRLVRPYVMAGGRTVATAAFPADARVQRTPSAQQGDHRWEKAQLIELVQTPMTLVQIAEGLAAPIGVVRVLVADLVEDGAVVVRLPHSTRHGASLLKRVLDGDRYSSRDPAVKRRG